MIRKSTACFLLACFLSVGFAVLGQRRALLSNSAASEVRSGATAPAETSVGGDAGMSGLFFDPAATPTPETCATPEADTMEHCHHNYVAGCSYSAHPRYDAYLNYLKNLLLDPNSHPDNVPLTRADFISREHSTVPLGLGQNNHESVKGALQGLGEGHIKKLTGVLYYAFLSNDGNGESCNCYLTDDDAVDFHIGIGFNAFPLNQQLLTQFRNGADLRTHQYDAVRARLEQPSVVVEMTPHYRAHLKPGWTIDKLHRAIGRQVLIVGQLMVDNAHLNTKDNCSFPAHDNQTCWRLAAWELHPVTQFYVCTAASPCSANSQHGWTKLEDMH